jgi:hypothetical protein
MISVMRATVSALRYRAGMDLLVIGGSGFLGPEFGHFLSA